MIKLSDKNEVLIRNEYYPDGLRENDIVRFHHLNKKIILNEVRNRKVIFCIFTNVNEYVIVRNREGKKIHLTERNFDELIHPRVVSIFAEIPLISNEWCIDIDAGERVDERDKKQVVREVLDKVNEMYEQGWTINYDYYRITNTSTGYHVFFYMKTKDSVYRNYEKVKIFFNDLKSKYDRKRDPDSIVIDFSVMRPHGAHVVVGSLNRNGLACMDITDKFDKFKRTDGIIDVESLRRG